MYYFLTLISYHASTYFGHICSPSSGGRVNNVANGTCFTVKATVGGTPTVALTVKQVPFATLHTQPPDDGLQMCPKDVEAW
jgi:hypothetical protein